MMPEPVVRHRAESDRTRSSEGGQLTEWGDVV
jgi:hypothetical protein